MLIEELTELMKNKEDELNEVRKKTVKQNTETSQPPDGLPRQKSGSVHHSTNTRKRGGGLSSFSSSRYVQNKMKEKHVRVPQAADANTAKQHRKASSLNRTTFQTETNWGNIKMNDPRLTTIKKAIRPEDLSQEDMEEVTRIFPTELMQILEFNDYKKILFEHLENPEFQKLLQDRFKAHENALSK